MLLIDVHCNHAACTRPFCPSCGFGPSLEKEGGQEGMLVIDAHLLVIVLVQNHCVCTVCTTLSFPLHDEASGSYSLADSLLPAPACHQGLDV